MNGLILLHVSPDESVYIGSASLQGFLHTFGPVDSNEPPNAPTISSETNGEVGEGYWYTFNAVDPDHNPITLYIDWNDSSVEDWFGPYASGEEVTCNHTWNEEGTYIIRAETKDTHDAESDWGYLEVTMPVNQQSTHPLFHWFLERLPNAFPTIRTILDL